MKQKLPIAQIWPLVPHC